MKRIILKVCEEKLRSLGYKYDESFLKCGEYQFVTDKYGFLEGLSLLVDRHRGVTTLDPLLINPIEGQPHSNLFYLLEGVRRGYRVDDNLQLELILEEILSLFISKAESWLEKNRVEYFDALPIFNDIVDSFFKKYSYERTYTDNNILRGGRVEYTKENKKVVFSHHSIVAAFGCEFLERDKSISLRAYAYGYGGKLPPPVFRTKSEYIDSLEIFMENFEKYCL